MPVTCTVFICLQKFCKSVMIQLASSAALDLHGKSRVFSGQLCWRWWLGNKKKKKEVWKQLTLVITKCEFPLPQSVCSTLWCTVGKTCHSKLDGAVDGTSCGEDKVSLIRRRDERRDEVSCLALDSKKEQFWFVKAQKMHFVRLLDAAQIRVSGMGEEKKKFSFSTFFFFFYIHPAQTAAEGNYIYQSWQISCSDFLSFESNFSITAVK